jgi:predicted 3-demethylubiquinone-9 3-methyltransferase (glyoxalase superfamily)
MPTITPFLMFEGNASEALAFYAEVFPDVQIVSEARYDEKGPGKPGTIMHATFRVCEQTLMCIDSPVKHGFTFTPAFSLYVTCETEAIVDRVFGKLSEGGAVMMPLASYPFSARYGWCNDRFGVSWQVGLVPTFNGGGAR